MPELPEVETIRLSLKPMIGQEIRSLYLSRLAPIETTTAKQLRLALAGARIKALVRLGKYLLIKSDREESLVVHLGMSGRLVLLKSPIPKRPKHTHLEALFKNRTCLRYIDARRFGTLSLATKLKESNAFLARLGPDYLDPKFNVKLYIKKMRRHPGLALKTALLNQGIAAGLGNIYACEALYRATLNPWRHIHTISNSDLEKLLSASKQCLRLGIKHCGTSLRDYFDGRGHRGEMQKFLQVYGREGQATLDGKGKVKRGIQQARSTFWCPEVQY
jgi:formamidopyrimidine-DNA glycosylase